ncbi:MAG TPA: hypothetical protein DEO65_04515 [Bacillus bacterium]|nr:hypothetical protein [Bacillus sp. (in: firmicutes)]
MNRSLKEQLKDWKWHHREVKQHRKPQKRRTERLTEFELKSLMDVNRPTYRRHRGSFRQR